MNRDREMLNRLIDIRTNRKPDRRQGAVAFPPRFKKFEDKPETTVQVEKNVMMIPAAIEFFKGDSQLPPEGGRKTMEISRKETGNEAYAAAYPSQHPSTL